MINVLCLVDSLAVYRGDLHARSPDPTFRRLPAPIRGAGILHRYRDQI